MSAHIIITDVLAIAAADLVRKHSDCSVEISYDDSRAEQIWEVTLDEGDTQTRYLVNDETGEVFP